MTPSHLTDDIAEFALQAEPSDLGDEARQLLKRNLLDSLGCGLGALGGAGFDELREVFGQFRAPGAATLLGGGRTSVDQAAFFNSGLIRYVDQLDTHLAVGGLCHPADNLGGVLAAAEQAHAGGEEFLTALAIAYELQCRFTDAVPVMQKGFNHAIQLAISLAAAVGRLGGLDRDQLANAIALSTVDSISLAAVHAEPVSQWKGFSPGWTAMRAIYATALAARGFTGPRHLFEGPHGLNAMFDQEIDLHLDDRELTAVEGTVLKRYCSLIHGQPVIEATLALRRAHGLDAGAVAAVTADVFRGAYAFAGGGEYGPKDAPQTKEQADYNLRYLIAAALLDDGVGPEQLDPARIGAPDVQELLGRVTIRPDDGLTECFPQRIDARITIEVTDGRRLVREQKGYEGGLSRPLTTNRVVEKFHWLSEPYADLSLRERIIELVLGLERVPVADLVGALGQASPTAVHDSDGSWKARFGEITEARDGRD